MKESKVKGKIWLPSYIVRNTTVKQIFRDKPVKHRHVNRKSINLSQISRSMQSKAGVVRPNVRP